MRGEDVIPEARRALAMLEGDNRFNMCVKFCSGATFSAEYHCARKEDPIHPRQWLNYWSTSHTTRRALADCFLQLTNGGGMSEELRCEKLSQKLGTEVCLKPPWR